MCDNLASIDKATNEIYGPGIINPFFFGWKEFAIKIMGIFAFFFFKEFKKNKYFMKLNLTYMWYLRRQILKKCNQQMQVMEVMCTFALK